MINAKKFNALQDGIAAAKARLECAASWFVNYGEIGSSSAELELKAAVKELDALRNERHQLLLADLEVAA